MTCRDESGENNDQQSAVGPYSHVHKPMVHPCIHMFSSEHITCMHTKHTHTHTALQILISMYTLTLMADSYLHMWFTHCDAQGITVS